MTLSATSQKFLHLVTESTAEIVTVFPAERVSGPDIASSRDVRSCWYELRNVADNSKNASYDSESREVNGGIYVLTCRGWPTLSPTLHLQSLATPARARKGEGEEKFDVLLLLKRALTHQLIRHSRKSGIRMHEVDAGIQSRRDYDRWRQKRVVFLFISKVRVAKREQWPKWLLSRRTQIRQAAESEDKFLCMKLSTEASRDTNCPCRGIKFL